MALKRVVGVEDAHVSFEEGRAVVRFDANATSPDVFIAELERLTGFTAQVIRAGSDNVGEIIDDTTEMEGRR